MSVDVTFYVGPDPAVRLDREQVLAFVGDLVGHRVVAGPWTILSGAVDPQDPLGMVTLASGMGGLCVVSVAKGDDPSELVSALANVYQEDKNLCVCLEGLDFRNPELKAAVENAGYHNGAVVLFFLDRIVRLEMFDAYGDSEHSDIELRQFLAVDGSMALAELVDSPLKEVVTRHCGEDLVTGACFA